MLVLNRDLEMGYIDKSFFKGPSVLTKSDMLKVKSQYLWLVPRKHIHLCHV